MAFKNLLKRNGPGTGLEKKQGKKEIVKRERERTNRLEQVRKYFRSVYGELKKVHWPTRREVTVYTGVVLVSVSIVGILIWIFDSLLSRLMQLVIK
ncbi:preprotein translocase subunit SecE [Desulfovirgula thermocuniculi]|uniref:preprotein translocase subunit SecE n=1 Tax=Desulfovirgula thermocuniculi TaxID=348842 RepID=UPI00040AC32F|nr:preprotein translocase subunit SecE [Desulfovirgula thermocuniculi]